ncbi:hypothetical protein ROT99_22430 [Citrobacter freundii complex sp. 2023EL-00966]|nr:hypothetical protein [Citrobacter freundii complex sp. 2023EL-00966]
MERAVTILKHRATELEISASHHTPNHVVSVVPGSKKAVWSLGGTSTNI